MAQQRTMTDVVADLVRETRRVLADEVSGMASQASLIRSLIAERLDVILPPQLASKLGRIDADAASIAVSPLADGNAFLWRRMYRNALAARRLLADEASGVAATWRIGAAVRAANLPT